MTPEGHRTRTPGQPAGDRGEVPPSAGVGPDVGRTTRRERSGRRPADGPGVQRFPTRLQTASAEPRGRTPPQFKTESRPMRRPSHTLGNEEREKPAFPYCPLGATSLPGDDRRVEGSHFSLQQRAYLVSTTQMLLKASGSPWFWSWKGPGVAASGWPPPVEFFSSTLSWILTPLW